MLLLAANQSFGEEPVPPVTGNTLWHWLGIPQGCNKIKDAHLNKSGDCPAKERKPPLKRIADPANLQSPNPAIQAAAKIKAEEDLAPQKVKAIKYLGTVGCGCYPGVRDALLAALDDCTEEVRYQAAIALCHVAGNPCKNCDKSGCCNAEVMNKLNEIAYGQDAKGCYKETSSRVRAAATNALNACKRKNPTSSMQPVPETPHETPEEAKPETKEMPLETTTPGPGPTPAPLPPSGDLKYAPPSNRVHLTGYSREGVAEASGSAPGTAVTEDAAKADGIAEQVAFLRWGDRCRRGYVPCPQYQVVPEQPQPAQGEGVKPGEAPVAPAPGPTPGGEAIAESAIPSSNAMASNYGATSGPLSSVPNMIGDFFGTAGITMTGPFGTGSIPLPGNQVSRYKMAEQTSPIPMDRIYFDYSFFKNVPITTPGDDVNCYTPGFEKTFCGGLMSVEVRAPAASTLDNDMFFSNGAIDNSLTARHTGQFGNMGVSFKTMLLRRQKFILSGGLETILPTARDNQVFNTTGLFPTSPTMTIENQAVHLLPFLGAVWTPNDRWFVTSYVQVDVDVSGDAVFGNTTGSTSAPTLDFVGRYHDTTFLYADVAFGYWARHIHDRSQAWTGLAYICEFHLNQSLEAQQTIVNGPFVVGGDVPNVTLVNLTVGADIELYSLTNLTIGYCTPITSDRQFDGQLRMMVNRRF